MVILKDEQGNDVLVDFDMMSTPVEEAQPLPHRTWCHKCGRETTGGECPYANEDHY